MASSFRDLNSSAGISSNPLSLLIAVLLKAHLTSHSRMSDWVTNHTVLVIGSLTSFLYSSFVHSFHRFLISSASTRSLSFLSLIVPTFGQNTPLMFPIFLERLLVFPLLLFSSIIKHCSLKKAFLSLLAIFLNLASNWMCVSLSPLLFPHSSTICKAYSDNHFAFLLFFFFGMVLFTTSCTILRTSVHSFSGTLLTRSSLLNLFVTSTANSYRI